MVIAPPIRPTLHLNALRAFEAAARLGGFTQAASELMVTPGAVAAQVKMLEESCGAPLFERHAKGVRLTPLGLSVRDRFSAAFDAVEDAARHLRRQATPQKVHIVTSPALAELWLGPRLSRLRLSLERVDISVTAVEQPPNLKRSPHDLCLFYERDLRAGQVRIADEVVMPVCVPALAARLGHPADLAAVPCIADVVWEDWTVWTEAVMPRQGFRPQGPGFSLYSVAVQQALAGAGVLMGRMALVRRHLESGVLVAPFTLPVRLGLSIAAWTLPETRAVRSVAAVAKALTEADRFASTVSGPA